MTLMDGEMMTDGRDQRSHAGAGTFGLPAPVSARHRSGRRQGAAVPALFALLLALLPGALHGQVPEEEPAQIAVVDSITVMGNERLDNDVILGTIGLQPRVEISFRDIQRGQKNLWSTGLFRDIQVTVRGGTTEEDPVVLVFHVEEEQILDEVVIRGLENLDPRTVRDSVGLHPGDPYSPHRVRRAKDFIRSELSAKGIPFASIEDQLEPVEGQVGISRLVLDVTEGHRVTIAQVSFSGNEAFRDSQLRDAMSTRQEGFWWFRSGRFDEERLEEDLSENLPRFYRASGYLDFEVLGDTLIVDPETGKARVEVEVAEGPQYRVADFSIQGNRQFPTSELEQYYQTERGGLLGRLGIGRDQVEEDEVFDQTAFEEAMGRVQERYRNNGYLYMQIRPDIRRVPAGSEGSSPRVEVGWLIEEGQPAYVNRIDIVGNEFTHDRVIREQIVMLPGDVYSDDRLLRSYQGISALGFFETPLPFPDIEPDPESGDVDITFEVEERQTGSVNFGTSMGGGFGVAGFIGYDQPNLFGQAKEGSLRWDFGRYQNNFTLSYRDPSLFQSRVSGTISLFRARDRFFQFASGERLRTGVLTRFGIPVPGSRFSRFSVGYSISRTDFDLREGADDTSLFGRPPGTQSTAILGFTRRTLDHPIFPTVGSRQSITSELSGGILGGDGDFVKNTFETEWWVPVGELGGGSPGSRPVRFSLGLRAKAGAIMGNAENFPFDRFWLGGVQFGERLRGYDETTLTPQGYFPRGSQQIPEASRLGDAFLTLSAEYAVRLTDNISVHAFYDAGNVWREPSQMDPSRLFRGAGFGADLVTPFGPIGLDYAYGFDRDDPGWQLHFRMGGQGPF